MPGKKLLPAQQETLDTALYLAASGYDIFPCLSKVKHVVSWGREATTDPEQIKEWWNKYPAALIGFPTGTKNAVMVIDIDTVKGHGSDSDGIASIKTLKQKYEIVIDTLCARTPSGGYHLFFKHHPGVKNSASKLAEGIDVRGDGGFVVVAPSITSEGAYHWLDAKYRPTATPDFTHISEIPDALLKLITAPKSKGSRSGAKLEDKAAGGESYRNRPFREWDANAACEWLEDPYRCISDKHYHPVAEGGRNNALNEAAGSVRNKVDTLAKFKHSLHHLNSIYSPPLPDNEVNTIIANGWEYPVDSNQCRRHQEFAAQVRKKASEGFANVTGINQAQDKKERDLSSPNQFFGDDDVDQFVKKVNREYFLLQGSGSGMFFCEKKKPAGVHVLDQCNTNAFRLAWAPYKFKLEGSRATQDGGNIWISHPNRRTYDFIDYHPYPPGAIDPTGKRAYNRFAGYPHSPIKGDGGKFMEFWAEYVCQGDEAIFLYSWKWFCHVCQHPDIKTGVALVLTGLEGVGKSFFANMLGNFFGTGTFPIQSVNDFSKNFNAFMGNNFFFKFHEMEKVGAVAMDGLKRVITESDLQVTSKYRDTESTRSFFNLVATTNENFVLKTGLDTRRFLILDVVNEDHCKDRVYFKSIDDELNNGGYAAVLYNALNEDLADFDTGAIPTTETFTRTREASLAPIDQWWRDVLHMGEVVLQGDRYQVNKHRPLIGDQGNPDDFHTTSDLTDAFRIWCRDKNIPGIRLGLREVGKEIAKYGYEGANKRVRSGNRQRGFMFAMPNGLDHARTLFLEHWKFPDDFFDD